ncbi:MAG: hypothetical protein ACRDJN_09505 [Chloroflexota bacterium]
MNPLLLFGPFLVPFGLVAALIGYAAWRLFGAATPAGRADAVAGAERWLEAQRGDLLPWDERAIGELSDPVGSRWESSANMTRRAKVQAVSRNGPLALYVSVSGLSGHHLLACTTAHQWRMQVEREPDTTRLRLWLDETPFGAWRMDDWALLDAEGEMVGRAQRPSTASVAGIPTTWDSRWFDVVLRGDTVGRIRAQRGAKQALQLTKLPAVEPASLPLPAEAERWLLAVVLVEHLLQESSWQVGPLSGSLRPGGLG